MLEHPGMELQVLIKEKGLTQKAFASILGKKVSEVNELLKGKRNITIQRDYLLHQTLGTPIKYWILKQIDYDYSLIDIEETPENNDITEIQNDSEKSNKPSSHGSKKIEENLPSSGKEAQKKSNPSIHKGDSETKAQPPIKQKQPHKISDEKTEVIDDEHKKRVKIFKSF